MPSRADELNVGIIGGGWIARRHVPALDAADGVQLVAACDTDLGRADVIAGPRRARSYQSWEEMLEHEALDALWVCTPPLFHRGPTIAALERGIHVYLEKPIARTLADAEAIASAAASSDAICMIGYQWHATELLDVVREATRDQAIGMLVGRNYGPVAGRSWFIDRAQGGGQILERGSHHIDLQRAIAGEIAAVQAIGGAARLTEDGDARGNIEDAITLIFHFRSGTLGSVNMAWTADGQPELYSLDVIASRASVWLELGPQDFRISGAGAGIESQTADDPFHRSIGRFLDVARSGDPTRVICTPDDALRTLSVALACERALVDGGTVAVTGC